MNEDRPHTGVARTPEELHALLTRDPDWRAKREVRYAEQIAECRRKVEMLAEMARGKAPSETVTIAAGTLADIMQAVLEELP